MLPDRPADVVVHPRDAAERRRRRAAGPRRSACRSTPRGRGTGNYGQAVPLAGGLVIDLSRCDRVLEVGDGWIRAEAGATFVALEAAARQRGQEMAMLPTTVGSTIGGFLAGGAGGLGSIEHGWLWDGFALSLDIVTCPPGDGPVTVHGGRCLPYLHAYGVTGIITAATVRLAPARDWVGVLASFPAGDGPRRRRRPGWRCCASTRHRGWCRSTSPTSWPLPGRRRPCRRAGTAFAPSWTPPRWTACGATIAAHGGRVEAVRRRRRRLPGDLRRSTT